MPGDFAVEGYEIEGLLGAGPAGEAWLARDQSRGTRVALKRVRPRDADARDEARRVVAVLGSVRHPHLLPVRELIPVGDDLVFVLDYAEGGSLGQLLLGRGTLDPGEVVTMATTVAGALVAVHERGLVHTDVTPENILFTGDARPMLADVGLLPLVEGGEVGTLGFTDPAGRVDAGVPANDVYGLAAVCYTALAGTPPQPGAGHRPLHQVAPGVPPGLAHVVEAGLRPNPAERPGASQFAAQVGAACPSVPVRFPERPTGGTPVSEHSTAPGPPPGLFGPSGGATSGATVAPHGRGGAPAEPAPALGPTFPTAVAPSAVSPSAVSASAGPAPAPPVERADLGADVPARSPRRRGPLVVGGVLAGAAAVTVVGVLGWRTLDGVLPDPGTSRSPRPTSSSVAVTTAPDATPSGALPSSTPRTPAEARWTKVLSELDGRRAEAWRRLDERRLEQVFVPASEVLAQDRAEMRAHADQGVTSVAGLNTPILSLRVVSESDDQVVLDVVSQLQPYEVEIGGRMYPHAGGEPSRFRMTLEPDGDGGWLIAASESLGRVPAR